MQKPDICLAMEAFKQLSRKLAPPSLSLSLSLSLSSMARPFSQALIQTSQPSLFATKSPPPTSRLLKLVQKLSDEVQVLSLSTVRGWPNFVNGGKLGSLRFKEKNFMKFFGYAFHGPNETHQALLGSRPMHLELDGIKISMAKGTCDVSQMQPTFDTIVECFPAHEGGLSFKFPVVLFLTNALMLTTPFVALAETCESDKSVFNMPLLLFVSLIGATVGGLVARQRKGELARLNEQLRQINAALRRQAKIESYAPTLSYAPVGVRIPENEVIIDPRKHELISRLKAGKNSLRNQDTDSAFVEFKAALELAQILKDPIKEKKAARGLGASLQRQGKYRDAIKYHSMVLEISEREREVSGNAEAYGAIADCYTELGDLERAGKFYDKYIAGLATD